MATNISEPCSGDTLPIPQVNHFEEIKKLQSDYVIKQEDCYEINEAIKILRREGKLTKTLMEFLEKLDAHTKYEDEYRKEHLLNIPF
jgi:hypothetical protein